MTRPDPDPIPFDLEAEESLLGACLLSREAIHVAMAVGVQSGDFYKPSHALIFTAVLDAHAAGEHADPVVIAARLNGTGAHIAPDGQTVRQELARIQGQTPASMNSPAYARIVRDLARRREVMSIATVVLEVARAGGDVAEAVSNLTVRSTVTDPRLRLAEGGTFTLDVPDTVPAVWGQDDRVLWAQGEELLIVGPPGVGKTTIAAQLVAARIGIIDKLLDLPIAPSGRVLYLACDRPAQIQRAFHRLFGQEEHRELLNERLVVWKGPPPRHFDTHPDTLSAMCRDAGADCVFIDSLKDVAIGLSDDAVGAGLNSAIQHALADGIDVAANHHQRKGQAGSKPRTLEDVYGSTWITAGAGSVVLLWGAAGDPLIELVHLKQPAAEIGPIQIDHDHNTGQTTVSRGDVDPLRMLRNTKHGMTSHELAVASTGNDSPNKVAVRKAKRTLDRLVDPGNGHPLAYLIKGTSGGAGGSEPDRYYATTEEPAPGPADWTEPDREEPRF